MVDYRRVDRRRKHSYYLSPSSRPGVRRFPPRDLFLRQPVGQLDYIGSLIGREKQADHRVAVIDVNNNMTHIGGNVVETTLNLRPPTSDVDILLRGGVRLTRLLLDANNP